MKRSLLVLMLAAACSSSTGPKGLDPTVLVINESPSAWPIAMAWFDQSGQVQLDSTAVGVRRCIHFTATTLADSVRFVIVQGDTTQTTTPAFFKEISPWFDPKTGLPTAGPGQFPYGAEYWTVTAGGNSGTIGTAVVADSAAPC